MHTHSRSLSLSRPSIGTACSWICIVLSIAFFAGCDAPGPKVVKSEEVTTTPTASVIFISATPEGVATVKCTSPYGTIAIQDYVYESYRSWTRDPYKSDKTEWQTYGDTFPIKLEGTAKAGDKMVMVYHYSRDTYQSGEVYDNLKTISVKKKD